MEHAIIIIWNDKTYFIGYWSALGYSSSGLVTKWGSGPRKEVYQY